MAGSIGAILVLIFGFIFVTVSAHLVGYVGSSNNPIVAMSIGGLLVTAVLFRVMGFSGTSGAIAIVSSRLDNLYTVLAYPVIWHRI